MPASLAGLDAAARRPRGRCRMSWAKRLAIFEADHSSSPLLKIAATFFDSTSSAAVSASARSLRCSSRSSSLMRSPVLLGLLRAGPGLFGFGQRLRGALPPLRQLLRVHAMLPAPRVLASLVHERPWSSRRRIGPPLSRPARERAWTAPLCQRSSVSHSDTNLTRNVFQCRALRRQQPRHRSVLECSVRIVPTRSSSSPPRYWFYRGDIYSDAGGTPGCSKAAPSGRVGDGVTADIAQASGD